MNFGYCIWAVPETSGISQHWYTNGFEPHLSIKTNIPTENEARQYIMKMLDYNNHGVAFDPVQPVNPLSFENIHISLGNQLIIDNANGFYSAYYNVHCNNNQPDWWPENAHISFLYQHNQPFTQEQINSIYNGIIERNIILDNIKIVKCEGHFTRWPKSKRIAKNK